MKNCLNEKTLLLLHEGEGSAQERAHVESCLICARRYRQLVDDIKDVVAILKQSPPSLTRKPAAYSGLRWSLAAGVIMGAFLLGRMTTADTLRLSHKGNLQSANRIASTGPEVGHSGLGPTYGLYIENLIGQDDETDASQVAVEDSWNRDSDGF